MYEANCCKHYALTSISLGGQRCVRRGNNQNSFTPGRGIKYNNETHPMVAESVDDGFHIVFDSMSVPRRHTLPGILLSMRFGCEVLVNTSNDLRTSSGALESTERFLLLIVLVFKLGLCLLLPSPLREGRTFASPARKVRRGGGNGRWKSASLFFSGCLGRHALIGEMKQLYVGSGMLDDDDRAAPGGADPSFYNYFRKY